MDDVHLDGSRQGHLRVRRHHRSRQNIAVRESGARERRGRSAATMPEPPAPASLRARAEAAMMAWHGARRQKLGRWAGWRPTRITSSLAIVRAMQRSRPARGPALRPPTQRASVSPLSVVLSAEREQFASSFAIESRIKKFPSQSRNPIGKPSSAAQVSFAVRNPLPPSQSSRQTHAIKVLVRDSPKPPGSGSLTTISTFTGRILSDRAGPWMPKPVNEPEGEAEAKLKPLLTSSNI